MQRTLFPLAPVLTLLLVGCAADPFERPGTWQPAGHNDANLRSMVVEPLHLQAGQGSSTSRGAAGAQPIDRLLADRRRPLPSSQNQALQVNVNPGNGGSDAGR
ncbi:hypothetical protein [Roseicella aerolata]|uniref:DUF3035 domain-containing protein n=1 Tax=Roseicella aerolata TaxID=2883479 RepID=A0A9X1IJH3_9PROT|nr:hypothetical protein [Roseicella aerolata]MCB4824763.1 hypothetical protein [Roseicella aerolata]